MVYLKREQRTAIYRKWTQDNNGLTYRQFRKTAEATFGMDAAVVVPWCGMWLAIETDGYVHS